MILWEGIMFEFIKQIRAAIKIKSEVKSMSFSEIKTSEGRLHIIGQIAVIYGALHGFIPAPLAAKISLIGFGLYTAGRAFVKGLEALAPLTKTDKDDKLAAEANKILDVVAPKP